MNGTNGNGRGRQVLERGRLDEMIDALQRRGYAVVGPSVRDGAIAFDTLVTADDLPEGWTDEQEAGSYRLTPRDDRALFGYAVGAQGPKTYLLPPMLRLWSAQRDGTGFQVSSEEAIIPKLALLGVRPCELSAIRIQDRVFMGGDVVDSTYASRRESLFIVTVNCGEPGGTCFCTSMGTGPRAQAGYDLALTEVIEPGRHYFVVDIGSLAGGELLEELSYHPATDEEADAANRVIARAETRMGRVMETEGIKALLYRNRDHPEWDDVASRCLSCANCTMVCPTCFCTSVEDATDLTGESAERVRLWDSCFTTDFSYIHGGSVRPTPRAKYRQWMTHKLASWQDQFGTSGCVGCGRCITWCPVGIDITHEARVIRETDGAPQTAGKED